MRSLPTRVLAALLNHNWPGNVRELGNRARRMVTLLLADQDGADAVADLGAPATPPVASPPTIARAAGDHSDDELMEALAEHGWQVSATARALGVSRKSLYVRIAQNANMHRARDLTSEALRDALAAADGDLGKAAGVLRVSVRALQLRLRELKMS